MLRYYLTDNFMTLMLMAALIVVLIVNRGAQIQPHFIFNSLSVIRSLAKRDSQKAVSSIDSFSDYLKSHIYYIQDDELISFEKELGHVITVSDTGRGADTEISMTEKEEKRLGVGIDNTRTRLKMQCNGTLDMKIDKEAGSTATIRIPR